MEWKEKGKRWEYNVEVGCEKEKSGGSVERLEIIYAGRKYREEEGEKDEEKEEKRVEAESRKC